MADALSRINLKKTPQNEKALPTQSQNHAGGYVFKVDAFTRALRFLILGTEGGTYYQSEKALTRENAECVFELANGENADNLLSLVLDVSLDGRAPRQNPTLFTLAALCASKNVAVRHDAYLAIPKICRTGTMLFNFATYCDNLRGWGMGLRKGIARWYDGMSEDKLAYQITKYGARDGWNHRDLLRKVHPVRHPAIYNYITHDEVGVVPPVIVAFEAMKGLDPANKSDRATLLQIIADAKLSWEQVAAATNDTALAHPEIWEALLPSLGLTALVRNLGRLARIGYTVPMSAGSRAVVERLSDETTIKQSRIHPFNVLTALATYSAGQNMRKTSSWIPVGQITDALDAMFYTSFGNVTPANKRTMIGLDVSGSMSFTHASVAGAPLSPREAGAALSMLFLRTEPESHLMAFSDQFVPLHLSPQATLREAVKVTSGLPFSTTDCSMPMIYAGANNIEVDTFVVITDNETWSGRVHPFQVLRAYRNASGIPARLAVIAMTSTGFSIADPDDAGMMDFVGFDSAAPNVLRDFSAGLL